MILPAAELSEFRLTRVGWDELEDGRDSSEEKEDMETRRLVSLLRRLIRSLMRAPTVKN